MFSSNSARRQLLRQPRGKREAGTKKMPRNSCYKLKLPEFMFRMSKLRSGKRGWGEGGGSLIPCGVIFKELDALRNTQSNWKLHKCVQPWWQYCRPESQSNPTVWLPWLPGLCSAWPEELEHSSMWPQDVQLARSRDTTNAVIDVFYALPFHGQFGVMVERATCVQHDMAGWGWRWKGNWG